MDIEMVKILKEEAQPLKKRSSRQEVVIPISFNSEPTNEWKKILFEGSYIRKPVKLNDISIHGDRIILLCSIDSIETEFEELSIAVKRRNEIYNKRIEFRAGFKTGREGATKST